MTVEHAAPSVLDAVDRAEQNARALLAQMTIPEKAGLLFHQMVLHDSAIGFDDPVPVLGTPSITEMVTGRQLTHFNMHGASSARSMAEWHNRLQDIAATTRLRIPITVSTDPRHAFSSNPGTSMKAGPFSQWPESLGLAATRDLDLVETYADTVRREYLAVGLRVALHPQIDLLTEPRWSRGGGTFGESSALTGDIVEAYLRGLHGGPTLGPHSVAAMVKHFPGGGPQLDGEDPHFAYGREQVYPAGAFQDHLAPFRRAIAAGATQMMPYYGMPVGTPYEEVGFGFNREILTDLLRGELGFGGIVCTDWGLLTDSEILGQPMPARAWGAEHLTPLERAAKALLAGADQFGGESRPDLIVALVDQGVISEARLDESAFRLLREKHLLGLFDDPYVDATAAATVVGMPAFIAAGFDAQRASITVISDDYGTLPVKEGAALRVVGLDPDVASKYGTIVDDVEDADVTIVRLDAPYEPRPGGFEAAFHAGSLDFPPRKLAELRAYAEAGPTIYCVYLDRPAILTDLVAAPGACVVADFGASDRALLDVLSGRAASRGKLPFDLPRSMQAVIDSPTDLAFGTTDPLYSFGHGL